MAQDRDVFSYLLESPEFGQLWDAWRRGFRSFGVFGLSGSQKSLFAASTMKHTGFPALFVTHTSYQARKIVEDLQTLLPDEEVYYLPATEVMPYEVLVSSHELLAQRLQVFLRLARMEPVTVVTTVDALMKRIIPVDVMAKGQLTLQPGSKENIQELQSKLMNLGYERVPLVEAPGQYSLRGGLLDVFPLTQADPARIEFFDDEVDSIRLFELSTQRSKEKIQSFQIDPVREMLLTPEALQRGKQALARECEGYKSILLQSNRPETAARLQEKIESYLEQLEQGIWVEGMEQFLHLFYPQPVRPIDYLHPESLIFIDEPQRIKEAAEAKENEVSETFVHLLDDGSALPSQRHIYVSYKDILSDLERRPTFHMSLLPKKLDRVPMDSTVNFSSKAMHPFLGKLDMLAEELKGWRKLKISVLILAATVARQKRLQEILRDYGVETVALENIAQPLTSGAVNITMGNIENGFQFTYQKLIVITDYEIFGREKKPRKPKKSFRQGAKIDSFLDLSLGDYVVHVNHGIGRYMGVEKLLVEGIHKDYLVVKYAGEDRLYVPTDQVHLLQKYVGAEGASPKVNKLGGSEWQKVKQKVKDSVREMAGELLKLYAAREAEKGFAFTSDTPWQREFEEAFPYEETPDQLRSIEEVKQDMEKIRPMDRLLCGDVGYGKTEVAIRAAFKAVQDGKQVAVMVPTTILAQQHYSTFRDRFTGYPVNIDVLSRFRSPKEQKSTIQSLRTGDVDIVIGTHRMVSADVQFKDLGLLIIDEEQRFGVAHKEKLKIIKKNVDVLTLSATPIPRTLNMSLVGLRDMSLIETPPEDRYPVQTYVVEYNLEMVREAIRREMNRGGQVYYVRNRVEDMERLERELQKLLPDARIGIAHGKMREDDLEEIMMDFLEREYDILLCTTIIETGLDVPNVNTLIVDGADMMGLSQLYQLRGRVGRSNRVAYAYFTYRKDKVLTEVAEKRLNAIREFTELGSGFKIAMRDLEIRGVGNLLGPEQHGQMASVGFDLYCRLLEEAVQELKGEKTEELPETFVEMKVDAFIPDDYISDSGTKVQFYKRLLYAKEPDMVADLEEELEDRFGDLPEPVCNLVSVSRLKALGIKLGISSIVQEQEAIRMRFFSQNQANGLALANLVKILGRRVNFSTVKGLEVTIKTNRQKGRELLTLVERAVDSMHQALQGMTEQSKVT